MQVATQLKPTHPQQNGKVIYKHAILYTPQSRRNYMCFLSGYREFTAYSSDSALLAVRSPLQHGINHDIHLQILFGGFTRPESRNLVLKLRAFKRHLEFGLVVGDHLVPSRNVLRLLQPAREVDLEVAPPDGVGLETLLW